MNNTFENVRFGVIVEDDENTVSGNTFKGNANTDIEVGTKWRSRKLSHPVTNTTITGNHFNSTAITENRIKLKYSPVNTVISGNTPADVNP